MFTPNIEKVRVTVEGVPNAVYSQGFPKTRLYEEARRLFGTGEISHQTLTNFFKDKKFALVIELRTVNEPAHSETVLKFKTLSPKYLWKSRKKLQLRTSYVTCSFFRTVSSKSQTDNSPE
jgi:hypothetical protein